MLCDIHFPQHRVFGIRIRPVQLEDAPFIVWLRNLQHVKGRLGDSAEDVSNQTHWLNRYFEKEGDYYFLVETLHGVPVGTHSIYNFSGSRAEIGRFAMRPGVRGGNPTPPSFLLLDLFYGPMALTELHTTYLYPPALKFTLLSADLDLRESNSNPVAE